MNISFLTNAFGDIYFQMPTIGIIFAGILTIILLFFSGFASGSEIAFFSLSPTDIAELSQGKTQNDRNIQLLREDSERTLATVLIVNNFINVTIIMLCNYIFGSLIHFGPQAYWLQFLIITVLLTFLLLLFGEIMPKIYSRQNPLSYCRKAVNSILFLRKVV